jgi:cytochrome d ubiquinol oxidase subunit II
MRPVWDLKLFLGSLVAAFVQGAAIGRSCGWSMGVSPATPSNGSLRSRSSAGSDWCWATACWARVGSKDRRRPPRLGISQARLAAPRRYCGADRALCVRALYSTADDPRLLVLLLGTVAMVGLWLAVRQRRDGVPLSEWRSFSIVCAFATLAASFWPYMIPCSVTVQLAAAPQSVEFLFWGAGTVVFPRHLAAKDPADECGVDKNDATGAPSD